MFRFEGLDMKHAAAAIVCTVLFSATCVLSAVGPARANGTTDVKVQLASHSPSPVIAPLA